MQLKAHHFSVKLTLCLLWAMLSMACQQQDKSLKSQVNKLTNTRISTQLNQSIDAYISETIDTHEIPGLAIAIIHNGQIIHKSYYGLSSLENSTPINEKTLFRIYSLSKLMTSISVFQLIQQGHLSLGDKLSMYFNDLPDLWQEVKIKHLLSHSSGLPDVHAYTKELSDESITDLDYISLVYKNKMDFVTGEQWRYNQTNFLLLKEIIEKITGTSFEQYVLKNQFPNTSPKDVLFSSDPFEAIPNRSKYYDFDTVAQVYKMKPEFPGPRSHPLNGINISLDEYIRWNERLDQELLIDEASKNLMWTRFDYKKSNEKFMYGWGIYPVNEYDSFGFSGGSVSGYRKFVDKNLSVMVLTNGYKYYPMQDSIIDHVAGMVDASLQDQNSILVEDIMRTYFLSDNNSAVQSTFSNIKKAYPKRNLQHVIKSAGYQLFFSLNRKQDAIELFKLNVLEYPDAYDTHGSLGYLYFLTDQFERARKYYVKALELNPDNRYSEKKIKQIDVMRPLQ